MSSKNRRKPAATSSTFGRAMRTLTKTLAVASLMSAPRRAKANSLAPVPRALNAPKVTAANVSAANALVKSRNPTLNQVRNFRAKSETFAGKAQRSWYNVPGRVKNYYNIVTNKNYKPLSGQVLKHRLAINSMNQNAAILKLRNSKNLTPNARRQRAEAVAVAQYKSDVNETKHRVAGHFREYLVKYHDDLTRSCSTLNCTKIFTEGLSDPAPNSTNRRVYKKVQDVNKFLEDLMKPSNLKKIDNSTHLILGQFIGTLDELYKGGQRNYNSAKTKASETARRTLIQYAQRAMDLGVDQLSQADYDRIEEISKGKQADTFWYLYVKAMRIGSPFWISLFLSFLAGLLGPLSSVWGLAQKYVWATRDPKTITGWGFYIASGLYWFAFKTKNKNPAAFSKGYMRVLNKLLKKQYVPELQSFYAPEIVFWHIGKKILKTMYKSHPILQGTMILGGAAAGLGTAVKWSVSNPENFWKLISSISAVFGILKSTAVLFISGRVLATYTAELCGELVKANATMVA